SCIYAKKILGNPFEFLGFRHTRHITARFARAEFLGMYYDAPNLGGCSNGNNKRLNTLVNSL
ncbi:MAG: hypothetical protein WC089_04195, partial [Candidatus Paceibacterota bacterium]